VNRIEIVGQTFGRLRVVADIPGGKHPRVICRCSCGTWCDVDKHHIRTSRVRSCGCLGIETRKINGAKYGTASGTDLSEKPGYEAVHSRLRRRLGVARSRRCSDCGEPAHEWSYDGTDPNELVGAWGQPYSTDLNRYVPRCRRCHRRFDSNPIALGIANRRDFVGKGRSSRTRTHH
jgi:hypothetical protein